MCLQKNNILFIDAAHKKFFLDYLPQCRYQDVYHTSLVYCLGISADTRNHIGSIYDFKSGCIKPECLREGWITSGSGKVVRLAFSLYTNATVSVDNYDNLDEQLRECRSYSAEDLFCCSYARFFWEAIKLRYPEYCYPN